MNVNVAETCRASTIAAAAPRCATPVGRAGRRRDHRAADRHHAHVLGRQLGAFRLAGGEPGHVRLRPSSVVMCVGKGWFERHWRRGRRRALALFGPLMVGVQPHRPAGAVQRDLPGLRPDAEVAAARQLPALFPAVPGRRPLPRHGVPEAPADFRPRLFRRPDRLGPLRASDAGRDVRLPARADLITGAAAPVGGRRRLVVRWHSEPPRRCWRSPPLVVVAVGAPFRDLPALLGIPTLAVSRLQGRRLRPQVPRRQADLPRASRRSAT